MRPIQSGSGGCSSTAGRPVARDLIRTASTPGKERIPTPESASTEVRGTGFLTGFLAGRVGDPGPFAGEPGPLVGERGVTEHAVPPVPPADLPGVEGRPPNPPGRAGGVPGEGTDGWLPD